MVLVNKLICTFNHKAIDEKYDIYQISTSENYVADGSYALDKPIQDLKAVSLVFDRGKSAFVLFDKNTISQSEFINALADGKLSLKKLTSSEIQNYVLVRLFIYALSNYSSDENKFNNIGGKLFLTHPCWVSKSGKNIKALEINIDREMMISAKATNFSLLSSFKKTAKHLFKFPKYILLSNGKFRRLLDGEQKRNIYINKGIPGKKAEISFLDLKSDMLRMNRAYFINGVIKQLNSKFSSLLSAKFATFDIKKKVIERKDTDFVEKSISCINKHHVYMTSLISSGAYEEEFNLLKSTLSVVLNKEINNHPFNNDDMEIVFLHNEDYYQDKDDPYKKLSRNHVVQCVTLEDSVDKIITDKKAVINTIFKEMTIKNDILNTHRISLDDWSAFGFKNNWYFGIENNGKKYFMTIHPDGSFDFENQSGFLEKYSCDIFHNLSRFLDELDLKGKTIVMDDKGNINVISRTNLFCLPNPAIFKLDKVSRSKTSREQLLSGVVDINLISDRDTQFYNAGIIGHGMNTAIPKANMLYRITIVKGINIIEPILETMAVMFVKYNNFTVLPYPIKYLREYIKIVESEKV